MCKRVIWWCLTIACAGLIVSFSLQSVKTSLNISGAVTDTLLQYDTEYQELPENIQEIKSDKVHDRLRSMAHIALFAALGFCASMLTQTYFTRRWWMVALPSSMVFAVVDEGVQFLRQAGRTFQIPDIGRDWLGLLIGTVLAAAILWIVTNKEKRKHGVSCSGT